MSKKNTRLTVIFLTVFIGVIFGYIYFKNINSSDFIDSELDYNLLEDQLRDTSPYGVVTIKTRYKNGESYYIRQSLGAIINKNLNNYQVVAYSSHIDLEEASFTIVTKNNGEYNASLVKSSNSYKLSLLEFQSDEELYSFPISYDEPSDNEVVAGVGSNGLISFGYAWNSEYNQSQSIILFSHSVQFLKLNETAVVVDTDNRLLGINIGSSNIINNNKVTNFAIPSNSIRSFLNS